MTASEKFKQTAVMKAVDYVLKSPPKMVDTIAKLDGSNFVIKQVTTVTNGFMDSKCMTRAKDWAPVADELWRACAKGCADCTIKQ